jgi:cytochrome c oxidase subunit II
MLAAFAAPAAAMPRGWEFSPPPAASPAMEEIYALYRLLFCIGAPLLLLLAGAIVYAVLRFNRRVHPAAEGRDRNPLAQAAWIVLPAIVLVLVAIPSLKLVYFESAGPPSEVTVQATGHAGAWTYVYPGEDGVRIDSHQLKGNGAPAADNPLIVPANRAVEVLVAASGTAASWSIPELGVRADAVPGHVVRVWFTALRPGIYYGQSAAIGGGVSAPVAVRAMSEDEYESWLYLAQAKITGAPNGAGEAK